jgi:hypothetical protein
MKWELAENKGFDPSSLDAFSLSLSGVVVLFALRTPHRTIFKVKVTTSEDNSAAEHCRHESYVRHK